VNYLNTQSPLPHWAVVISLNPTTIRGTDARPLSLSLARSEARSHFGCELWAPDKSTSPTFIPYSAKMLPTRGAKGVYYSIINVNVLHQGQKIRQNKNVINFSPSAAPLQIWRPRRPPSSPVPMAGPVCMALLHHAEWPSFSCSGSLHSMSWTWYFGVLCAISHGLWSLISLTGRKVMDWNPCCDPNITQKRKCIGHMMPSFQLPSEKLTGMEDVHAGLPNWPYTLQRQEHQSGYDAQPHTPAPGGFEVRPTKESPRWSHSTAD